MTKNALSSVEKSVLKYLELDSRMSFSKIGKKTRMSQQRVSYIVNSLIKKGTIKKFYTLIDYSKFDVVSFRVYFKVNYTNEPEFDNLLNHLKKESSTSWVATCESNYDIICTFLSSNASSFNKTLKEIMRSFPKQLQNYVILTTIVIRHFGRKYLFTNNHLIKEDFIGGDREAEHFSTLDLGILKEISDNARLSSVEIAKRLNTTPKTIIQHIKELTKREVILGFKYALGISNIGYKSFILLVKSHNVVPEIEDKLVNYLKMHPNVTLLVKTLGEKDFEIHIEADNWITYRKIAIEIRERFPSLIQDIETIPLHNKYHKISYFPEFLI